MKLIICANRLPLTIKKNKEHFDYQRTSGGLVTGIRSLSEHIEFTWFGNISGMELTEEDKTIIEKDVMEQFNSVPVFIDVGLNDLCYDGFCNAILWPTIHSFPDNVCFTFPEYDAYKKYNEIFAEKILNFSGDDDIVWVHDYHLMLVPEIIRRKRPNMKIMFFLHTAFCEPSNLSKLLCAEEILRSLSHCGIVGFHTPEYAGNFILALKEYKIERMPQTRAISIGIEPKIFRDCLETEEAKEYIKKYSELYKGKKIILGVDRTDYIKGMPQRFKGIERFLERNKEDADKYVFLQVAIPSRLGVKEYSAYVEQINGQIEHVNSTVGNISHTPVQMIFDSVSFPELCALYAVADAILITSVMDGMNLVAMEYIACQDQKKGSVILSEFTGATCTLVGSVFHNANNSEEIAIAIEKALSLTEEEKTKNHNENKRAVDTFTSIGWAAQSLKRVCPDWEQNLSLKHKNKK